MILPKSGRVVVIDNNIDEALPLLKVLSKNNVPTAYFTGEIEELPDRNLENIRLMFLDLKLIEVTVEKTIFSTLIKVLKKIISEQNGPYALILWTVHELDYKDKLSEMFRDELNKIKPVITLALQKFHYFETNDSGKKIPVENALALIENKIKAELKNVGIFHIFSMWENLVHKSAGAIVNDFSSFYSQDDNWNVNMSRIFWKLARAYGGKNIEIENANEITKNALFTFNNTFLDALESNIRINRSEEEDEIKFESGEIKDEIKDEIKAKINSKLLLVESDSSPKPGNIYETDNKKKEITLKIEELYKGDINSYSSKEDLIQRTRYIFVEVSPYCDYAQDKWRVHRILQGLLWPGEHSDKIKKADFIYTSPVFEIKKAVYKFVFDLRYLDSVSLGELEDSIPLLRIRHELLVDIQSHLARHINRPGVISLGKD